MRYIVDRIEGGLAVCEQEDGSFINIALDDLPQGVHEGSVLDLSGGEYIINSSAEKNSRDEISALLDELFIN